MKYIRYLLITVLLYLFITSSYSYIYPSINTTANTAISEVPLAINDKIIAQYRSLATPWVLLIGLILTGWIFFFKRRVACGVALTSIILLAYIIWKDFIVIPGSMNQKVTAIEYGQFYPLNWMTAFYLISAILILFPIIKKSERSPTLDEA